MITGVIRKMFRMAPPGACIGLGVLLFVQTISSQQPANNRNQIIDGRPLAAAASALEETRGKIVTYEEPVLTWMGDLEEIPGKSGSKGYLYPKERGISVPSGVSSESDLRSALNETLDAYHTQTSGTRFQVLQSKWGYHITPLMVHDSNGVFVAATSLLGTSIYVPAEERTAKDHLTALGAAVSAATGMAMDVSALPFQSEGFDRLFRANPARFSWGAEREIARDALIDLLSKSATSFSWRLNCQASTQANARFCVLNVNPVTVAITNVNGQPDKRALWFDRCGDCPPLRQVLPAPAR